MAPFPQASPRSTARASSRTVQAEVQPKAILVVHTLILHCLPPKLQTTLQIEHLSCKCGGRPVILMDSLNKKMDLSTGFFCLDTLIRYEENTSTEF